MRNGIPSLALEARSALGTGVGQPGAIVFQHADLQIVEEAFLPVVSLRRSRIAAPGVAPLLQSASLAAPDAPNRFSGDATLSCAWIEPHAWLVIGPRELAPAAHPWVATGIGERLVAFRVSGPRAGELLASASPAALPSVLAPGRCARTKFGDEVEVLIQQLAPQDYRLLFDVGLARYAASWLAAAAGLRLNLARGGDA